MKPLLPAKENRNMTYTLITANRNYSSWSLRPWLLMKALDLGFAGDLRVSGGAASGLLAG